MEFLLEKSAGLGEGDLIYVDPPYFEKGRMLYYDAYGPEPIMPRWRSGWPNWKGRSWVVSYDDVDAIRSRVRVRTTTPVHDRIQCA